MENPYFFGYGSLVNQATHLYPNARHATAHGWRRAWVNTAMRPYSYLTAVRAPGAKISGLIAEVPGADWIALDEREDAYDRLDDTENVVHTGAHVSEIAIYAVPVKSMQPSDDALPILRSYLDVVLQGYMREFGLEGAQDFLETTDGWEAPILDDRSAPIYPRHQILKADETAFVDAALARFGSTILRA